MDTERLEPDEDATKFFEENGGEAHLVVISTGG
jgi:hypothetical protein